MALAHAKLEPLSWSGSGRCCRGRCGAGRLAGVAGCGAAGAVPLRPLPRVGAGRAASQPTEYGGAAGARADGDDRAGDRASVAAAESGGGAAAVCAGRSRWSCGGRWRSMGMGRRCNCSGFCRARCRRPRCAHGTGSARSIASFGTGRSICWTSSRRWKRVWRTQRRRWVARRISWCGWRGVSRTCCAESIRCGNSEALDLCGRSCGGPGCGLKTSNRRVICL